MQPERSDMGYRFVFPRWSPMVRRLIIINVVIFLVQFFLVAFRVTDLSAYLGVRADLVLRRGWIWQIVTYMFLHGGVFHIFFNMLALYFFGTQVEEFWGRRRFLTLYFGGGIAGGLAYCGTQLYTSGGFREECVPAIGASAAVMAILVVCAICFPKQLVFFWFVPIPIRWLVTFLIAIDLLYSIASYKDGVAHFAHLGGALYGFLSWRFSPRFGQFLDRLKHRRRESEFRRRADAERRVDEILAKISRKGFDSLTRGERAFLKEQSRRRRDGGYRS